MGPPSATSRSQLSACGKGNAPWQHRRSRLQSLVRAAELQGNRGSQRRHGSIQRQGERALAWNIVPCTACLPSLYIISVIRRFLFRKSGGPDSICTLNRPPLKPCTPNLAPRGHLSLLGLARLLWPVWVDSYRFADRGEMAEWLKAHAWKACIPQGIQGSNPCLSATFAFQPALHPTLPICFAPLRRWTSLLCGLPGYTQRTQGHLTGHHMLTKPANAIMEFEVPCPVARQCCGSLRSW